jgi:uncharacterized repeat protein (TIGR01451 family)
MLRTLSTLPRTRRTSTSAATLLLATALATACSDNNPTGAPLRVPRQPNAYYTTSVIADQSKLDFGSVIVGMQSDSRPVTFTNVTTDPLNLAFVFEGLDSDQFSYDDSYEPACGRGKTLAAGASCVVGVRFKPTREQPAAAGIVAATGQVIASNVEIVGTGIAGADLALTMTGSQQGRVIAYNIKVENRGPSVAKGVMITDFVPQGTTFASIIVPPNLTCLTPVVGAAGVVSCSATKFVGDETATVQLTVKLPPGSKGGATNTAEVSSTTEDPVLRNNAATVTTGAKTR